ncbi:hypothetical protein WIS52_31125 [Pseudonocardia nematodicida]|uniref:Uncharacterized protein n=1 Tax=Pseudonocardia nematodicida TaxID=1206997 RepID=A0ABV1KKG0_9PSEU
MSAAATGGADGAAEVGDEMLDVRVSEGTDPEALVAFVERLAGSGDSRPAVRSATSRIAGDVRDGRIPAGLRTLSTALESPAPPPPRRDDESETFVSVVADRPFVVLSDTGAEELAHALGELTGYGMRVLLTGSDARRLDDVRGAVPAAVAGRVVDRLPGLRSTDLRRLRRLLATAGADRDARAGQELPSTSALPTTAEVTGCCERAARIVAGADSGEARIVPGLLRGLDADRRAAVTQVSRCVLGSLGKLSGDGSADAGRAREVTGRLVHHGLRAEFESLQNLAARQRDDRDQLTGAGVQEVEPLPPGADDTIRRYLDHLEGGGRARAYFRPQAQRDAEPLLRCFRVDGGVPQSHEHVRAVVEHLYLARRDDEIARLCAVLDLPVPRSPHDLPALIEILDRVAAAARSVGALRHDVLFLQQDSPLSVPDLAAAERIARAITDYDDHGDPIEAADEIERLAAAVEGAVPEEVRSPEHEAAVAALRARDPEAYASALDDLVRAHREVTDRAELDRLLGELAGTHPELARTWAADAASEVPGSGLLHVVGSDALLSALPQADSADLVVVLGAGAMQADGLLLTAAAPRVLAVVGDEPRAASSGTTLVEVLNQASARFLRGTAGTAGGAAEPAVSSVPEQPGPVEQPVVPAPRSGPPESAEASPGAGDEERRPSAPSAMAPAHRPVVPVSREADR